MGHEHSILSDLIGYSMVIYGGYCFLAAMKKPRQQGNTLDCFELFTIYDKQQKPAEYKASIKISDAKKTKPEYNQLQRDCFDALKSIGISSAKERKYLVNSVFNKYNPETVQDFIKLAMAK